MYFFGAGRALVQGIGGGGIGLRHQAAGYELALSLDFLYENV